MLSACTAGIEVFSHAPIFSYLSTCAKVSEGEKEREKTVTVNRCIRSDSARLWRHILPRGGNFSDHTCDELSSLFFRPENAPLFWRFRVGTDKRGDDSLDDEQNWNIANRGRVRARIIINATTFIAAMERIIESLSAAATGPSAFHHNYNEKKVISHSEARIMSCQEIVQCYIKITRFAINTQPLASTLFI